MNKAYYKERKIEMLDNYEKALQWEAQIKPISRGQHKGVKPFGNRRSTHISIRKDENAAIHVRLYETDVTTFYPDGLIVMRLNGWPTQTSCFVLGAIHGQSFFIHDHKVWTARWGYEENEYGVRQSVRRDLTQIQSHGDTVFQRIGERLIPVDDAGAFLHHINREEANNVREKYKPFRDYLTNFIKVREKSPISPQEVAECFGLDATNYPISLPNLDIKGFAKPKMTDAAKFMLLIDPTERESQHEDYYKAAVWLGANSPKFFPWRALDMVNNLLMYTHRDIVFKKVPMGDNLRRDAYRHFFD